MGSEMRIALALLLAALVLASSAPVKDDHEENLHEPARHKGHHEEQRVKDHHHAAKTIGAEKHGPVADELGDSNAAMATAIMDSNDGAVPPRPKWMTNYLQQQKAAFDEEVQELGEEKLGEKKGLKVKDAALKKKVMSKVDEVAKLQKQKNLIMEKNKLALKEVGTPANSQPSKNMMISPKKAAKTQKSAAKKVVKAAKKAKKAAKAVKKAKKAKKAVAKKAAKKKAKKAAKKSLKKAKKKATKKAAKKAAKKPKKAASKKPKKAGKKPKKAKKAGKKPKKAKKAGKKKKASRKAKTPKFKKAKKGKKKSKAKKTKK